MKFLCDLVTNVASRALSDDKTSEDDKESLRENSGAFRFFLDRARKSSDALTIRTVTLAAIEAACIVFAVAPPDRSAVKRLQDMQAKRARNSAKREKQLAERRDYKNKIAEAFRDVSLETGKEIKEGAKWIDKNFREQVAKKLEIELDKFPSKFALRPIAKIAKALIIPRK